MKKKSALIVAAILILSACAPSAESIQQAIAQTQTVWTPIPTQTAYPTYTAVPTIFVTKIVTPTFTPTPIFTPTVTNTPAPTIDPMKKSRSDGYYFVGVDIAPGVWKSNGSGDGCYWAITTETGDIIDNHFGGAGGTAYIPASGFQVEFRNCGLWKFLK